MVCTEVQIGLRFTRTQRPRTLGMNSRGTDPSRNRRRFTGRLRAGAGYASIQRRPMVEEGLIAIVILLSPFEDTALRLTPLGFFGASPSGIFALLLLISCCSLRLLREGRPHLPKQRYLLWAIGVILTTLVISGLSGSTQVINKAVKVSLLLACTLYFAYRLSFDLRRYRAVITIAWLIALAGWLVVDRLDVSPWWLHATPNLQLRDRGFALESSTFGVQVVVLGLLSAVYARRLARPLIAAVTVAVMLLSDSKGGIIAFGLAIICYGLTRKRSIQLVVALAAGSVLLAAGPAIAEWYGARVDFGASTSVTTRVGGFLIALFGGTVSIVGVGPGGLIPLIHWVGGSVADLLRTFIPAANYNPSELLDYVNTTTGKNVSLKSFFADSYAMFGWIFLILYARWVFIIGKSMHRYNVFQACLAIFFMVAITFYVTLTGFYVEAIGFAFLWSLVREARTLGSI